MYTKLRFLSNGFSASPLSKAAQKLSKLPLASQQAALSKLQVKNPSAYATLVSLLSPASAGGSQPTQLLNPLTGLYVTPYLNGSTWTAITNDSSGNSIVAIYSSTTGWINQATGQPISSTYAPTSGYYPNYQYQPYPPSAAGYNYPTYGSPQIPQTNSGYQAVYNYVTGQWIDPTTGYPIQNQPYQPGQSYPVPYYGQGYQPYPQSASYYNPFPTDPSSGVNDQLVYDRSGVPPEDLQMIQAGLQEQARGLDDEIAFDIDPFNAFPRVAPYGSFPRLAPYGAQPSPSLTPWVTGGAGVAALIGLGIWLVMKKKSPSRRRRRARR